MFTPTSSPNAGTTGARATPSGRGPPSLTTTMGPRRWSSEAKAARAWARMQNEHIAALCAAYPDRFVGVATLPMQDPALAVEELRWVRERLGLRAIEIGTFPGNRDFDDPMLFPFFEACAALDVVVFVHPAMPVAAGDRLTRYDVREIVHYPLETTVAVAALIFGGV